MKHIHLPGRRSAHRWIGALALTSLLAACGGDPSQPLIPTRAANHLYTLTNESQNAVVHFVRRDDGTLLRKGSTATGGKGTNGVTLDGRTAPDSLVSQHAVVADADTGRLFAVNAGDHSISVLSIDPKTGELALLKRNATSAGMAPNSLAYSHGRLYATFLRGTPQVGAFKVHADGTLSQLGSYDLPALAGTRADVAPTQSVVAPGGAHLVVSAGIQNDALVSFGIESGGQLTRPVVSRTQVKTPFAGVFVPHAKTPTFLSTGISDVSLSAYHHAPATGTLTRVGHAVAPGVKDPCWIAITPDGRVAYVGNGSGAISSFSVGPKGEIALLHAKAAIEPSIKQDVPSVAGDSWISPDGKYLYTAFLGADKVVAYRIGSGGSLVKLNEVVVGTASGLSLQGLVGL